MSITTADYRQMLCPLLNEVEFQRFLNGLEEEPQKGAAFDPVRLSLDKIRENIENSTIDETGSYFFYPYGTQVGRNPLYLAGAFYPLDRSAYAVGWQLAKALEGRTRLRVLDMCAAPGGKSAVLSFLNKNIELLVSNDISLKRAKILKTNMERLGVKNSVITSIDPCNFPKAFDEYFDAVVLDAPCSGSGMSRKKEKMDEDWNPDKVIECVKMQEGLTKAAVRLLAKGGILCYSTCSYSPEEDEDRIKELLSDHSELKSLPLKEDGSIEGYDGLGHRYIPGLFPGEGQYLCLLKKDGEKENFGIQASAIEVEGRKITGGIYAGIRRIIDVWDKNLLALSPLKYGYTIEDKDPKSKFPYDWDLCHYGNDLFPVVELNKDQALRYLSGQDLRDDLPIEKSAKVVLASYCGYPLGFLKVIPNRLRNMLPKGLRITL